MKSNRIVVMFRMAWDMPIKMSDAFGSISAAEKWARNRKFVEWTVEVI